MILSVSSYWPLSSTHPRVFKRLNSYAHSINFDHEGTLLTFHDHSRIASPMSIRLTLNETDLQQIFSTIHEVTLRAQGLCLDTVCYPWSLCPTTMHQLPLTSALTPSQQHTLQARVAQALHAYPPQEIEASSLHSRIEQLHHALLGEGSLERAVEALIGAGPGLTPTGDDVLLGVLVGLNYQQNERLLDHYKRILKPRVLKPNATVWLSQQFLAFALEGWVIEPLVTLIDSLQLDQDIDSIIDTLRTLGHSSGQDVLQGLWLAISTGGNTYDS